MAKTKNDENARVAGRRNQTKDSVAEQLHVMDNFPMGLNESDDLSVSDNSKKTVHGSFAVKFPNIYQTFDFP